MRWQEDNEMQSKFEQLASNRGTPIYRWTVSSYVPFGAGRATAVSQTVQVACTDLELRLFIEDMVAAQDAAKRSEIANSLAAAQSW